MPEGAAAPSLRNRLLALILGGVAVDLDRRGRVRLPRRATRDRRAARRLSRPVGRAARRPGRGRSRRARSRTRAAAAPLRAPRRLPGLGGRQDAAGPFGQRARPAPVAAQRRFRRRRGRRPALARLLELRHAPQGPGSGRRAAQRPRRDRRRGCARARGAAGRGPARARRAALGRGDPRPRAAGCRRPGGRTARSRRTSRRSMSGRPRARLRRSSPASTALFERVRGSLEHERRFTADAAHELRTPIAALRAQAEVALAAGRRGRSDATRSRASSRAATALRIWSGSC